MTTITGKQIADFLGQGDNTELVALADQVVPLVALMAKAYTRGQGFTGPTPNDELAAVITTASARMVANPEQIDHEQTTGPFTDRKASSFTSWSLAETYVLNRYRKRAQ
ncbi:hypothetical protein [Nocardia transvalensis]|uniref:hypothetical protein n=1 Tax=Nocardia transvalensis TaxID=37333 RepID=UPI001895F5EA|nr:hypothetical protein [Nocardia transvalensis]MBF6330267.1 hypothetical protein [Nocardia transvalensis]